MATTKEVLSLAVEIADVMLRNGGEIYRIEDTVVHILKAYDVRVKEFKTDIEFIGWYVNSLRRDVADYFLWSVDILFHMNYNECVIQ